MLRLQTSTFRNNLIMCIKENGGRTSIRLSIADFKQERVISKMCKPFESNRNTKEKIADRKGCVCM